MNVEKRVKADLSVDNAYKHMAFLVDEVGQRLAGTEEIEKAANYILDELKRCGLEARIDRFPIYQSYPGTAAMRVISPKEQVIEAQPSCHVPSTLDEGLTGELVYVGAGGYEDYENVDVKDKIVLADMTWSPPRPEKARIAVEYQAKAIIILNWGLPDDPVIQKAALKSVWGNPTPESFGNMPQIPSINITKAAGEHLKELCSQGKVVVWFRANSTREWVLATQPVAVLRSEKKTDEFLLVGGHLEGWGRTAICNSSGNAMLLELVRVLAKHRDKLERDIIFTFWDGHEIAEAAGSTYFVDSNWDDLTSRCVAYVDIDNPAILGTEIPFSRSAPEVKGALLEVMQEVWGTEGVWRLPYKGGDQSFFGVGVPYISFATGYTPEELERLSWASLSPWIHSEADTLDKIDRELYETHVDFFATLIVRLCNAKVIPYDLLETVALVTSHLNTLKELADGIPSIELDSLISRAGQLKVAVQRLNEYKEAALSDSDSLEEETVRFINGVSIKVSRALSILWTEAGKYDQDPYGYYLIGKPIPRLYVPITKLKELDEGQEFNLWQTKFVRERNRVSDIIGNAIEWLASVK